MTGRQRGTQIMRRIHAWAVEHGREFDVRDVAVFAPRQTVRSLGNSIRWLERYGMLEQVGTVERAGVYGSTIYRFRAVMGVEFRSHVRQHRKLGDPEAAWARLMGDKRFEDQAEGPARGRAPSRPPTVNPSAYS
jgi:hypothetical protein